MQELLTAQDEQLRELQRKEQENASAMKVLIETVEDTMPIEETQRLVKELEQKIGQQLNSQLEEIAVELSDAEDRLGQKLDEAQQRLAQRIDLLEASPWAADLSKLEQSQFDLTELTHTFSSQLESGLSELDREIKSVGEELSRSVAQAADVRQASRGEVGKLSEGIAALDSKLDQTTMQLATRIDERAQTLDGETADLAAQVDATLEKVHNRVDSLTGELQQFVSRQDDQWRSTAETTKGIHAAIESLQGETDALVARCTHTDAAALQAKQELTATQDRQLSKLEKRVEQIQADSENATSKLSATLERVQRQGVDSAERIDAVHATLGNLGADISGCGKDIAQSIEDCLLCRQELQQATQRFDARLADLGNELHSLDANLSSSLAQSNARAEAISVDVEQGVARNAELSAELQDAFDRHVGTADQRAVEVAARLQTIENDGQASRQEWISTFQALEKKQSNDTDVLSRRADEVDGSLQKSLTELRAEVDRHISESWSEQADRLAGASTQLTDAMAGMRQTLERQISDTDAANRSSIERLTAEWSSRTDTVRDSLEDQISRSGTEARTAMAKLESDLGLLVDRSMGTLEQQLHERSASHDNKLTKSSSELSSLIQTVRAELEKSVIERCSGQDARIQQCEMDAQERLEKQQLDMTKLQGELDQRIAEAADTAKHELTTYIAAQERASKESSLLTRNAIEDASSTLEARILERMRSSESRLVEAVSGMSDDIQKTRAELDGAMRERMASLDSGMRALEAAIRSEVDATKHEMRAQISDLGTEHDTKLGRTEADIGDRLGTVEDELKAQLDSINAGLQRQLQEGLADAEAAYNKVRSDLMLQLDNKCSTLQREQQQGDAQVSTTLSTQIESAQSLLSQTIAATEKKMEERCTSIHEFADHTATKAKEDLQATIAQQVGDLAGQSAQLESDVSKLVEETCAALDEHWSGRLSEQIKRIADFESAIVKASDTTAAGLKQQISQVTAEQNTQLRHLVSQATDFDHKIDNLKSSVEGKWTVIEAQRQAAASNLEAMDSRLAQLQSDLQTTVMETLGGLSAKITENETEHDARLGELEGLVNKTTAQHAATAQHTEDMQTKLSQIYADMSELVQTTQLTIEEQMNASVATQDRRMTKTEEIVEAVAVRVSQCEAAGVDFDNSLRQLSEAVGNVSTENAQQVAQSTSQWEHQLTDLEALVNANLAHVTEQGQQLKMISADMSADIDRRSEAIASRVSASQSSLSELQSAFAQTEARLRDLEAQSNVNADTVGQQYAQLAAAQNGLSEQVSDHMAILQDAEVSANRNTAAVEELRSNIGSITEEIMRTVDSATKSLLDTTSNVTADVAEKHSSVLEELDVMRRSMEEAKQRIGATEASINASGQQVSETSQAIKALQQAIDDAADLSKAQLDATAQASETRVLGVESRLENLATVLGTEVQGVVGTMRDEVEGMLNPYEGRMMELEAAVNTGVVRMGNTETRIDEISATNAQTYSQIKTQLDDVDKVLDAQSSSVTAQLREAQSKADAAAADLRSLVEDRAQAAVATQKEALARLQAEMTEVRTRTVPELGRQQASTDAQLKKLQSEVWQGSLNGHNKPTVGTASGSGPSPEESASRLGQLEQRTETLKGTVGKALEMLGRLRNEHGTRISRLEEAAPAAAGNGKSTGLTVVQEGVPGIPAEQLRRIAEEFGKRSGGGTRLTFAQTEQSIHALGFACSSSYFAEVWRKYDQGGTGSLDFPRFCEMWLFMSEGLER